MRSVALLMFALSACSAAPSATGTYAAGDATTAIKITLVEGKGIRGSIDVAAIDWEAGKVRREHAPLTGTKDGTAINLTSGYRSFNLRKSGEDLILIGVDDHQVRLVRDGRYGVMVSDLERQMADLEALSHHE
tara:strand:- start:788 stop:1186 length:399 start_codon:yes stop_codon:yes gene_type:complete